MARAAHAGTPAGLSARNKCGRTGDVKPRPHEALSWLAALLLVACAGTAEHEPSFLRRPVSAWARDLRDTEQDEIRQGALQAIRALGPAARGEVDTIATALDASDPTVRRVAALALGAIGPHARAAAPGLVRLLGEDPEPRVRAAAAQALGETELAIAVDPLVAALVGDPDRWVREAAGNALGALGAPACPAVLRVLQRAPRLDVRLACVRALGRMGDGALAAVPALVAVLHERWVGRRAARALGRLGPTATAAIPELSTLLLSDGDAWGRRRAAEALGRIGPAALPSLLDALAVDDGFIRLHAVKAVGAMGPAAASAAPAVARLLADPRPRVRHAASRALLAMGEAAVPALVACIDRPEESARHGAIDTLGRLGRAAKAAVPALARTLHPSSTADLYTRQRAVIALQQLGRDGLGALDALMALMSEEWPRPGWFLRADAAAAVEAMERKAAAAEPVLALLLEDERPEVREAAGEALRAIGSELGEQPDPYADFDLFGDFDEELPGLEPEEAEESPPPERSRRSRPRPARRIG